MRASPDGTPALTGESCVSPGGLGLADPSKSDARGTARTWMRDKGCRAAVRSVATPRRKTRQLLHWELSTGQKGSPAPDPPAWVMRAYEALPR